MLVNRCASSPPVQLSAAAIVALLSVSCSATTSSSARPSWLKMRSASHHQHRRRRPALVYNTLRSSEPHRLAHLHSGNFAPQAANPPFDVVRFFSFAPNLPTKMITPRFGGGVTPWGPEPAAGNNQ